MCFFFLKMFDLILTLFYLKHDEFLNLNINYFDLLLKLAYFQFMEHFEYVLQRHFFIRPVNFLFSFPDNLKELFAEKFS